MPNTVYKNVKKASKKLPDLKDAAKEEVQVAKEAKSNTADELGFIGRHFTKDGRARMARAETAVEQAKLDVKDVGDMKDVGKTVKADVGKESSSMLFFHDDKKLSAETKSKASEFMQSVDAKQEEIRERVARLEGIADNASKDDEEMEVE